jgi:hypothetical protein
MSSGVLIGCNCLYSSGMELHMVMSTRWGDDGDDEGSNDADDSWLYYYLWPSWFRIMSKLTVGFEGPPFLVTIPVIYE